MARFVYCFTNPEMPDLVKIGKTDNVEGRLKQLSGHAAVPVAFECPIALEVENADQAEKLLHEVFRGQRINPRREFFRVGVEHVRAAMLLTGGRDATPTSDVVEDEEEQVALNRARKKARAVQFRDGWHRGGCGTRIPPSGHLERRSAFHSRSCFPHRDSIRG